MGINFLQPQQQFGRHDSDINAARAPRESLVFPVAVTFGCSGSLFFWSADPLLLLFMPHYPKTVCNNFHWLLNKIQSLCQSQKIPAGKNKTGLGISLHLQLQPDNASYAQSIPQCQGFASELTFTQLAAVNHLSSPVRPPLLRSCQRYLKARNDTSIPRPQLQHLNIDCDCDCGQLHTLDIYS